MDSKDMENKIHKDFFFFFLKKACLALTTVRVRLIKRHRIRGEQRNKSGKHK